MFVEDSVVVINNKIRLCTGNYSVTICVYICSKTPRNSMDLNQLTIRQLTVLHDALDNEHVRQFLPLDADVTVRDADALAPAPRPCRKHVYLGLDAALTVSYLLLAGRSDVARAAPSSPMVTALGESFRLMIANDSYFPRTGQASIRCLGCACVGFGVGVFQLKQRRRSGAESLARAAS